MSYAPNTGCPQCGGTDRFFLVAQPRNGGTPFRLCRQCNYHESATPNEVYDFPPKRTLTVEQQQHAQRGYAAAARWCAEQLWEPGGAAARAYLRQRGFSDDTIRAMGLGFHPDTWQDVLGSAIFKQDVDAYDGMQLGGLTGPQGKPKNLLRGTITIPYTAGATCTTLRTRKLNPGTEPKYLSPAGVDLYTGATPTFFLHDVLEQTDAIILTEGEFKALAAWQAWQEGVLSLPAIAQPSVGYLPDVLIDALRGKTVYLCYDSEQRKDPFELSPGERYTIQHGEALTGLGVKQRLVTLRARQKQARKDDDQEECTRVEAEIARAEEALTAIKDRAIRVKVLRLPRPADVPKIDLDSYLLEHGPITLQQHIDAAPSFDLWHAQHGPNGYSYRNGSMFNGRWLANYQTRIVEDVTLDDGMESTAVHRLALRTPTGQLRMLDVPTEKWSDPRRAMEAVRAGLHEAIADDEGKDTLRAIKKLSMLGDGPAKRTVFTCTGWQNINGRWHYLIPDGSITSTGVVRSIASELPATIQGNQYALCGSGDAQRGAAAFKRLLDGTVCPQPLAVVLAAHAALAVLHTFTGDGDRPAIWVYGESGVFKSSLVRVFLSLFGPRFTKAVGGGAALAKRDATYNGLERLAFDYRDALLCIDDYKQATAGKDAVARFLYAYSESTGRSRMTRSKQSDRTYPARCMLIGTGEDRPASGDTGQLGRVLLFALNKGDVDSEQLAHVQDAGAQGDLAAFWREFVQQIAAWLDRAGTDTVRERIQAELRRDDEALLGHQRTVGALRQNRAAWLLLAQWLQQSGFFTLEEVQHLNAAHIDARRMLAHEQQVTQQEERPSTIFLDVLREMLATGEMVLEDDTTDDGSEDEDQVVLQPERILGFRYNGAIAVYPKKAFALVQKQRGTMRAIQYSEAMVYQQLRSDGLLVDMDTRGGKTTKTVRHAGHLQRVLLLRTEALDAPPDHGGPSDPVTRVTNSTTSRVTSDSAFQSSISSSVTPVTPVTLTQRVTHDQSLPSTAQTPLHLQNTSHSTARCNKVTDRDISDGKALNGVTPATTESCNTPSSPAASTPKRPQLGSVGLC
jgi:Zn ribbon nucleic-acid-binding protein